MAVSVISTTCPSRMTWLVSGPPSRALPGDPVNNRPVVKMAVVTTAITPLLMVDIPFFLLT
jgi:hypothetical protein